jgi:signal transduction histidine kinase
VPQETEVLIKRVSELEEQLAAEKKTSAQLQQELKTASDLLKATLNQLPVVICGIDNDGGIVFLNREFERVTGYSAAELLTRPDVSDYLFPDRTVSPAPINAEREWNLKSKEGKDRVISWSEIQDCPIQGWEKWKVGLDTTHLKQLERLRDDVESIVHHDLKSPLGAIIGLSSWLLEQQTMLPNHKKALRNIEKSGERMLHMLENSLALYKIEAGEFEYHPGRVNLVTTLRDVFEQLAGLASSHRVKLSCTINGQELASCGEYIVTGIESLLDNLMTNVVKNAIEASPPENEVRVTIMEGSNTVLINTANQGAVPSEIRDHFFDRFVTHGKEKGTGLGTYSAKLITEAHGGHIAFNCPDEHTTHLLIELPA